VQDNSQHAAAFCRLTDHESPITLPVCPSDSPDPAMPLIANKPKAKKGNAIIGDATDRLLRAAKEKILREKGRIDYDQLRQEGFTAEMIARLKAL